MKLYLAMVKNAFQSNIAYKMDVFLHFFGGFITLFIQISIWSALLVKDTAASASGTVTLKEMITYTILTTSISILASNNIIQRMEQKVRTGEIAMDLIKPLGFKAILSCETAGITVSRIIFEMLPLIIIGALFFGIKLPTLENLLFFVVAALNGLIISFLLSYIFGLYVLWYLVAWHMC